MAGDWIKWAKGLPDKPEVIRLAGMLALTREVIVCRLMRFWEWCDDNIGEDAICENGSAFVDLSPRAGDNVAFIDALVWTPGFADSMASVNWLRCRDGRIELPNFGRHNGETAKTRARNAKNQKRKRQPTDDADKPPKAAKPPPVTNESPQMSPRAGDIPVTRERGEESLNTAPTERATTRPVPDSPHHRTLAAFVDAWKGRYGTDYPVKGGKDGKAIKEILIALKGDEAKAKAAIDRFFADSDDWLTDKRHGLGILQSQLEKWIVDTPRGTSGNRGTGPVRPVNRIEFDPTRNGIKPVNVCGTDPATEAAAGQDAQRDARDSPGG